MSTKAQTRQPSVSTFLQGLVGNTVVTMPVERPATVGRVWEIQEALIPSAELGNLDDPNWAYGFLLEDQISGHTTTLTFGQDVGNVVAWLDHNGFLPAK